MTGNRWWFWRVWGLAISWAAWTTSPAPAQPSSGYVFFAPGGVTCCGNTSMTLHVGVGGEGVLGKGIGIGAEIGAVGSREYFANSAIGVFSVNGYYHFIHSKTARLDPFATAGYSLLFREGHANFFNYGGGVNYWFHRRFGMRVEIRDHTDWTVHYWGARIGLAIR